MKYIAVSKESGKKVLFKSKDAMNAALKAGTHTIPKQATTKSKGKSVFGKGKKVFGGGINKWDDDKQKVVTFKNQDDYKKASRKDPGRYMPIHKAHQSKVNVSSVIKNGKKEAEFYNTMEDWSGGSGMTNSKALIRMKSVFDLGKKKMPKIFKPDVKSGSPVYRGLAILNSKTEKWLKKTDWRDWKPITDSRWNKAAKDSNKVDDADKWYIYTGKNKKSFTYNPHLPAQSWTKNPNIAFRFTGDAMLTMPLTNEFYFSSKYMNRLGYEEDEVIRLGTKTNRAQLLISGRTLRFMKHNQ